MRATPLLLPFNPLVTVKASRPGFIEVETEPSKRGVDPPRSPRSRPHAGSATRNSQQLQPQQGRPGHTCPGALLPTHLELGGPTPGGLGGGGLVWPLVPDTHSRLSTLAAPTLRRPHLPSPGPSLQPLDGTSPLCLHPYLPTDLPEAHLGSHPSPPQTPSMAPHCLGTKPKLRDHDRSFRPSPLPSLQAFVHVVPSAWKSPYCGRRR